MALTISAIVCAHNEASFLAACLHSLLAQTRVPDEILVINNASTDATGAVARSIPRDLLIYLDADCRAPLTWVERVERRFVADPALAAMSGPYRYYDWDWWGRVLIRAYDWTLAPATQLLVKHLLRIGTVFYFRGADTNVGRRLYAHGRVILAREAAGVCSGA